jgi:hypothetical protein
MVPAKGIWSNKLQRSRWPSFSRRPHEGVGPDVLKHPLSPYAHASDATGSRHSSPTGSPPRAGGREERWHVYLPPRSYNRTFSLHATSQPDRATSPSDEAAKAGALVKPPLPPVDRHSPPPRVTQVGWEIMGWGNARRHEPGYDDRSSSSPPRSSSSPPTTNPSPGRGTAKHAAARKQKPPAKGSVPAWMQRGLEKSGEKERAKQEALEASKAEATKKRREQAAQMSAQLAEQEKARKAELAQKVADIEAARAPPKPEPITNFRPDLKLKQDHSKALLERELRNNELIDKLKKMAQVDGDDLESVWSEIEVTPRGKAASSGVHEKRLRSMFDAFDADGSGSIDKYELADALREFDIEKTEDEIEALMLEVDLDANGTLDFEEFAMVFSKQGSQTGLGALFAGKGLSRILQG